MKNFMLWTWTQNAYYKDYDWTFKYNFNEKQGETYKKNVKYVALEYCVELKSMRLQNGICYRN